VVLHRTSKCRSCGSILRDVMVDLGSSPLANSYVPLADMDKPEVSIPLTVLVCDRCRLVQLHHSVDRADIFSDYAYQSSWSSLFVEHAKSYVGEVVDRLELSASSNVVELASNDGYLLQWFVERGIPVLGIDPAANVAPLAEARGVPTLVDFFGVGVGHDVRDEQGAADLIIANNVLAHVDDLHDFVGGMAALLAPTGRVTIEFPHVMRLIDDVEFDTVYHEHFSYFSLLALEPVFHEHGLRVVDVDEIPVHGGSLRVWLAHAGAADEELAVAELRGAEKQQGLDDLNTYLRFGEQVAAAKRSILRYLVDELDQGHRIAAYGAAAKGNTLLNYCGIGTDMIEFAADRNPEKQDHLLPGSRIPVYSPEYLTEQQPDGVVLLAWNLKDELVDTVAADRWGGTMHVLRPTPTAVGR
jgi:SAM-dependent methyltransferase